MIIHSSKYFLDLDTNLFNVYDILENEGKDHIIIVIPTDSTLFDGQINFDIIRTFCDDLKKVVVIVTEDEKGLKMIQRSGLVGVKKISQVTVDLWQVAEQRVYLAQRNNVSNIQEVENVYQTNDLSYEHSKLKYTDESETDNDSYMVNFDEKDVVFYVGKDVKKIVSKSKKEDIQRVENFGSLIAGNDYSKFLFKKNDRNKNYLYFVLRILSSLFFFRKNLLLFSAITICILISALVIFNRFLISEVLITTVKEEIVKEFKVILSESYNEDDTYTTDGVKSSLTIEEIEDVSISKTFNISKKTKTGNKAVGLISLYNLTDQDINLPVGTKVKSLILGKEYVVTKEVVVPKVSRNSLGEKIPQSVEDVTIQALEYGESYNLSLSQGDDNFIILLDGYDDVSKASGRIFRDIKGGESFEVFRVLQSDVDDVIEDIKNELRLITKDKLLSRVLATEIAFTKNINYILTEKKILPDIGEDSADGLFTISMKMKGELPKISKFKLDELAKIYFQNVNEKQLETQNLKSQILDIVYDEQNKVYHLNVGLSANVISRFSEEYIFNLIKGKFDAEAKYILSNNENISSVNILFKPGFVPDFMKYIPTDKDRVQIRII